LQISEPAGPEEAESNAVARAVSSGSADPLSASPMKLARPVARLQRKVSPELGRIEQLLRDRGFFESKMSAADTHQVLTMFKAMSDYDLRDTVWAMETQDKNYIERFLTHIGADDQLNEMETLRRVKNARVWKTETKKDGTTVTTEVTGSCSPDQFQAVTRAANTAVNWLNQAVGQLDSWLVAPGAPGNYDTATALETHFDSKTEPVGRHVRERLARIRDDVERAPQFSIECHGVWDRECANADAYASPNEGLIVFCGSYFSGNADRKAETIIHEMAHDQVGGAPITDRAYQSDRMIRHLSTEEALTNAESYGMLAQQLGTRQPAKPTAPADKAEDCPPDWKELLQKAAAVAQRWNRNLQVTLGVLKPVAVQPPSKWANYLGGATQSNIDAAKKATDKVASKLESAITFECEPGGGGRCNDGDLTYWYATGHLHVCPAWKAPAKEDARAQSLLAGLYGYAGDVGENARQNNYAQLAAENNQGWAVPKAPEIFGGTEWKPDYIHIDVTPLAPMGNRHYYSVGGDSQYRMSEDTPIAPIPAPPAQMVENNLRLELQYYVDYGGNEGRPLPFTAPEVSANLHFDSPAEKFDRQYSDMRPVYQSAGSPLATHFPTRFEFSIRSSGSFHLHLELKDPDTKVARIYDDTIQLQVAPPPGTARP
jgi:hypothetical protein